jgi:hypothetical protein
MASDYAALSNDFYINARLNLKMDLSMRRDTVLSLFDRVRRERPAMDRFKRYSNELALESRPSGPEGSYEWLAVRRTSVRSGCVNPAGDKHAHDLHRAVLESAPFFLDITPLDIDHLEVLFGFDLAASGNHDAIVLNALMADSPLATLCAGPSMVPIEFQPMVGLALNESCDLQAFFEVKTRTTAAEVRSGEYRDEPISVYVILRKAGPFGDIKQIPNVYDSLVVRAEELLDRRIVPNLLVPIRDAIAAG